jgi:hypothetical protein
MKTLKKRMLLVFILYAINHTYGQNLVNNPGFDTFSIRVLFNREFIACKTLGETASEIPVKRHILLSGHLVGSY